MEIRCTFTALSVLSAFPNKLKCVNLSWLKCISLSSTPCCFDCRCLKWATLSAPVRVWDHTGSPPAALFIHPRIQSPSFCLQTPEPHIFIVFSSAVDSGWSKSTHLWWQLAVENYQDPTLKHGMMCWIHFSSSDLGPLFIWAVLWITAWTHSFEICGSLVCGDSTSHIVQESSCSIP